MCFLTSVFCFPQENQTIEYLGSINSGSAYGKKNTFRIIGNLLFGKDETEIRNPVSVYAENPENVWILCQGNGTLVKKNKNELSVLPAFRKAGNNMPSLVGMCLAGSNILITDSYNEAIYKISSAGNSIERFPVDLNLERPTGIAYSEISDEIWVAETSAHRIRILDRQGNHLRYIGRRGSGEGEFNYPTHIWIDDDGTVYIVDSMNFRVQIFSHRGEYLSSFGKAGNGSGDIARPKGIATDSYGNIYLVDALFHTVQIFDRDGNYLYRFGGQGREEGQFWMPNGIYIDQNNYIYVSDNYNNRVQVFRLIK